MARADRIPTYNSPMYKALLYSLLLAPLAWAQTQPARIELPDFGDSSARVLTPQQDRESGEQLRRLIAAYRLTVNDPLAEHYVSQMGQRLAQYLNDPAQELHFYLLEDPSINAFATVGGIVALHAGLVLATDNADQLAAVTAHEIAHVTQRHIARSIENQAKVQPLLLAGMVALALAGGNSRSAGDVSDVALVGGMNLMQQQQINFTRGNEYEADRVGIHMLRQAGYHPAGMAEVFQIFMRRFRTQAGRTSEYLRTHPLEETRIAEAKARGAESPQRRPRDLDFELIRERVRLATTSDLGELERFYAEALPGRDVASREALDYGRALTAIRSQQPARALDLLNELQPRVGDRLTLRFARARALIANGQVETGLALLDEAHQLNPKGRVEAVEYADALLTQADARHARRAQELIRGLLARIEPDPALYQVLARASEQAGDRVRAVEATAEFYFMMGAAIDALGQLKGLIEERVPLDYYQRARVEARIAQIEPIVLEQRRRWLRAPEEDPQSVAVRDR